MIKGTIFNVQRFSLYDGPGIRTTVFFKGCPLSCWWCHNPEGIGGEAKLVVETRSCIGCASCVTICPEGALSLNDQNMAVIDYNRCNLCRKCLEVCPTGALELIGREVTVDELVDELLKDRIIFEESGGGVTLSGGEPLQQDEFIINLLKALKKEQIHTVVDTSGCAPWETIEEVAKWTDLFLYDLKLVDRDKSMKYTGVTGDNIRLNLQKMNSKGINILIRVPLIPTVNDDPESLRLLGEFLRECGITDLELLSYHKHGIHKKKKLGEKYQLADVVPPVVKEIKKIVSILSQYGLNVIYKVDEHYDLKRNEQKG
ncbi:MAG: glycyl-radical enzyme activating protein [Bacillota bacterium]|nr:glycyl-radical enzyme activating protein [Bacillota bacterium]